MDFLKYRYTGGSYKKNRKDFDGFENKGLRAPIKILFKDDGRNRHVPNKAIVPKNCIFLSH